MLREKGNLAMGRAAIWKGRWRCVKKLRMGNRK
jgi:hypothetical protein